MLFAFGRYQFLVAVLVPLALTLYAVVLLTVPTLRRTKPNQERPFKVWGGSWFPAVIALFYLGVVAGYFITTPGSSSVLLLIAGFLFLSFPVYWFVTMVYNPDAIISVSNMAARVTYLLEDLLLPKRVREELVDLFRTHIRGKTVLEFGSGVGTLTEDLANAVGPKGTIIAVDFSKSNLTILEKRFAGRGTFVLKTIHDEHQINRLHPGVTHADAVYSVGFLGYMQDLRKVLRELSDVLPTGGRVCFVEYVNFFKVLPDPAIVSDIARLEASFRDSGFSVSVKKRRGFLWNYLIIEGIKSSSKAPYI
jgi:SAM-dependent methyltransferase